MNDKEREALVLSGSVAMLDDVITRFQAVTTGIDPTLSDAEVSVMLVRQQRDFMQFLNEAQAELTAKVEKLGVNIGLPRTFN